MSYTALFDTIHRSHCTISTNFFTFIYSIFNKKFQFQQNKQITNGL